jgi:hypothetical protein
MRAVMPAAERSYPDGITLQRGCWEERRCRYRRGAFGYVVGGAVTVCVTVSVVVSMTVETTVVPGPVMV